MSERLDVLDCLLLRVRKLSRFSRGEGLKCSAYEHDILMDLFKNLFQGAMPDITRFYFRMELLGLMLLSPMTTFHLLLQILIKCK